MSSDLTEFFKKKKEENDKKKVDWEKEKNEWLKVLAEFYDQIGNWIKEPVAKGYLEFDMQRVPINEMYLGNYQVPFLVIKAGVDTVTLKPVGKLVLGFNGRIDMSSFTDTKTLVFIKDKGWFLFEQSKKENLKPFTEELFTELLKEMLS